jgi:uncharacterized protein YaiL (DUF2058 family)
MGAIPIFLLTGICVSSSLRDQLLQAGLITEKQRKQAEQQQSQQQHRQQHHQKKKSPPPVAETQRAAQLAQAQKAARDQELSRKQQEKAERKARTAQIRQLVEQNRLPVIETEDRFNFIDRGKVRYVGVDAARRELLNRSEVAIVRYGEHYAVVPAEIANRIRERDETAVVPLNLAPQPQSPAPDKDDPYASFVVPDDLKW